MTLFEIGEIINPEDHGLRLQITSLKPLEGVIVKNSDPTSYVGRFFPVGKQLVFTETGAIDTVDKDMPWFILSCYQGRKRFEHYR